MSRRGEIFGKRRRRRRKIFVEGKYLKEENIWRREISGKWRRRRTEKDEEENILEKESDDGPTNK